MFNREDDYLDAIRGAQVYSTDETKSNNIKLTIFNILLLSILAYLTLIYLKNNTNIYSSLVESSLPISKQAVLGVSETVDESEFSNDRLMEILKTTEVDSLEQSEKSYSQNELQNSMKVLMSEPVIQSKSSYTEGLARELDDKSGFRGKISVAKKEEVSSLTNTTYIDALTRELDNKSGFKGKIAVVKQGDTLSSLAQQYYGNSQMFSKIINANKNIINGDKLIIGQSINIPN